MPHLFVVESFDVGEAMLTFEGLGEWPAQHCGLLLHLVYTRDLSAHSPIQRETKFLQRPGGVCTILRVFLAL
jgi:hypothetical protein